MVTLFLLFWGISRHSSTVAVPVCIPTSSEWGFPFLHNLSKLVICLVDNNIGFWYISMLIDVSLWTFGYFWFFLLFLTAVRNILGYVILFTCVRENSKPREFLGIGVKGSSTLLHNAKLFSKVLNTKFPLADCESSHFVKRIIHFYREEQGGRETSMYERNIDQLTLEPAPDRPGTDPETQACALTKNWTGDLLFCRMMPNQLNHTSQAWEFPFCHILTNIDIVRLLILIF